MIDLQTVGEVVYTGTTFVCMRDDYHFVTSIDQFGRELVDVTFNSSWLGEEEVTDHSDVVRHLDAFRGDLSLERYMSAIAGSMDKCVHVLREYLVGCWFQSLRDEEVVTGQEN